MAIVRVEELNGVPDDVRRLPRIAPLMRALWRMKVSAFSRVLHTHELTGFLGNGERMRRCR